jgi:hypothetical protein
MNRAAKSGLAWAFLVCTLCLESGAASTTATIRSISVLGAGGSIEVEVVASSPVNPQAQVITGPDRVILDFPNAVPGNQLRNLVVNRGELKSVRVGRFSENPPTTRVVLDLKTPQPYQLFPSGKTVIVKLASSASIQPVAGSIQPVSIAPAANVLAASLPLVTPTPPPAPRVKVSFANGKLKIWADKATLAEVLTEVRHRTGADLTIPPGTGQEKIVADLGPAPAREVLAQLLNGSSFNFVMVGSDRDSSQLRGVFLTTRNGGGPDMSISYPATPSAAQVQGSDPPMQPQPDVSETPAPEPEPAQPDMAPSQAPQPEEAPPQ